MDELFVEVGVGALLVEEFCMCAGFDDAAVFEDEDVVGAANG